MNRKKFPLPNRFWVYCALMILFAFLLYLNVLRTDGWTGDKALSEYTKRDWIATTIFLGEEIIILVVALFFARKMVRVSEHNEALQSDYFASLKLQDIDQVRAEFDYVWFDFSGFERALIKERNGTFLLTVQDFDEKTENWTNIGSVSVHPTLNDVKRSLFYDCDFYCDENAEFDKYGDEVFKE